MCLYCSCGSVRELFHHTVSALFALALLAFGAFWFSIVFDFVSIVSIVSVQLEVPMD